MCPFVRFVFCLSARLFVCSFVVGFFFLLVCSYPRVFPNTQLCLFSCTQYALSFVCSFASFPFVFSFASFSFVYSLVNFPVAVVCSSDHFVLFQLNYYLALPWLFWEIFMIVYTFGMTIFLIAIWNGVSAFHNTRLQIFKQYVTFLADTDEKWNMLDF